MKQRFLSLLAIACLCVFLCAFDWPPENYEMPRTVLTTDIVKSSLSGLVVSIRAIANTGINIIGVLLPVFLIFPLFDRLFLREFRIGQAVNKRAFGRAVRAADRKKNREAIIDERVAEMEINQAARKKFRELYPRADLEERLYQRELLYSEHMEYTVLHPDDEVEDLKLRMSLRERASKERANGH